MSVARTAEEDFTKGTARTDGMVSTAFRGLHRWYGFHKYLGSHFVDGFHTHYWLAWPLWDLTLVVARTYTLLLTRMVARTKDMGFTATYSSHARYVLNMG
jgi:hypothetical protein